MVIYLIGVHHSIQHDGGDLRGIPGLAALREQFRYYLIGATKEFGISVLAEELNEDVLAIFQASESAARLVAGKLGLSHVFCEPNARTRSSLGFTKRLQRQHHFVRERLWYDKIADYQGQRIIFICGANHIPTFSKLVREKGQSVVTLTAFYGRHFFESFPPQRFCRSLCPRLDGMRQNRPCGESTERALCKSPECVRQQGPIDKELAGEKAEFTLRD